MEAGIFLLYSLFAINDADVKNFLVEANKHNSVEYQIVEATPCKTGMHAASSRLIFFGMGKQ